MHHQRFKVGDKVWVSPKAHADRLVEDEGLVTEVFDYGYLVYQEGEQRDSAGSGWCAHDNEVSAL